jgi:hypothetical protein
MCQTLVMANICPEFLIFLAVTRVLSPSGNCGGLRQKLSHGTFASGVGILALTAHSGGLRDCCHMAASPLTLTAVRLRCWRYNMDRQRCRHP